MGAAFNFVQDIGGADGAPGSSIVLDSLGPPNAQFRTDDTTTVDGTNECISPSSGTNYSFAKSCYIKCTTAPATQVDNMQIYTSGTNPLGTGIDIKVGQQFPTKSHLVSTGYKKATGIVSVTGNEMTTFYTGVTSTISIFSLTQSSSLLLTITDNSGKIVNVNDTTNYFVLQMWIQSTAAAILATPNATLTLQWDEI
jgi:hypothetical protein